MSALGQKRTYAVQEGMSALPPIATAKADSRKRSCPLYPRKRTCAVQRRMSALGQKRTSSEYSTTSSAIETRGRDCQSERLENGTAVAARVAGRPEEPEPVDHCLRNAISLPRFATCSIHCFNPK